MSDTVILKIGKKEYHLPVVTGIENEKGIDISKLRQQTGYVTLDPGYVNTGSCKSSITFLDGEKGTLRYRGIPIEQLAKKSSFLEVAYLLIYGSLPTQEQYKNWEHEIKNHTLIHEDLKNLYNGFPKDGHPMAIISSIIGSLSAYYHDSLSNPLELEYRKVSIIRLIAKFPTIASLAYRKITGKPNIYPKNSLDYCSNFLNMMFSNPTEDYEINPKIKKALDLILILHADHEQNCSTSAVRIVGSSLASVYSTISAGICALWGPRHGGANQEVIQMLEAIHSSGKSIQDILEDAKNKNNRFRLSGFGHRVYKNFDPRAKIIKKACDEVLKELNIKDPLLDIAKELEERALEDSYFVERKLYPNVDFYSGIIYKAIGIPVDMFTVIFAMGRLPGWLAHWNEMMQDKNMKIGRPRQIYIGESCKDYN